MNNKYLEENEVTLTFEGKPIDGKAMTFIGEFKTDPYFDTKEFDVEEVTIIAGKINNCNTTYYWKLRNKNREIVDYEIGGYAIVKNMNDYDLAKIVGIVETKKKYVKFITGVDYDKLKDVVNTLDRDEIRED